MNDKELNDKLKQINTEDLIWVIYIGIIIMSWYSNYLERKFYINKDLQAKEKYQKTMIFIFSVLLIIYVYFFKSSYDDFKKLNKYKSKKKRDLITLSFIASLLILISGAIFLYIALVDNGLDVELAFN